MEQEENKAINAIAESSDSPGQFIRTVMAMRNMTTSQMAKKLYSSTSYVRMVINNMQFLGTSACVKISKALDIDPLLLGRLSSDYKIKNKLKSYDKH